MACGRSRTGPPPARGPVAHDVDDTWLALRRVAHDRLKALLLHAGDTWSVDDYWAIYDAPLRAAKTHSEAEDLTRFDGAAYRGFIKLFDITIDERRIQGYNGLQDWEKMRDYFFRAHGPDAVDKLVRDKRLLIHGGNAAWPRMQIASRLVGSDDFGAALGFLVYGKTGATPAEAEDDDIVARIEAVEAMAHEPVPGRAAGFASKVFHVFAPDKWPVAGPRAGPEVGARFDLGLPDLKQARQYLDFAKEVRAFAAARKHEDLARTDLVFANEYDLIQAEQDAGDDDIDLDEDPDGG